MGFDYTGPAEFVRSGVDDSTCLRTFSVADLDGGIYTGAQASRNWNDLTLTTREEETIT